MMAFLTPGLLLFILLILPVIALYMLRLRREEVIVSSTMLWQRLLLDREANTPWQRLRRNLLLILQVLILIALVLAIARPYLPVPTIFAGNVVVVIDGSASMLASDVQPNRFAEAKRAAHELIDDLGNRDHVTLILATDEPAILATTTGNKELLRTAVDQAEAVLVEADWASTLALAAGTAQGYDDARIVVISDGGLPDLLPPVAGEIDYIKIGNSDNNLAITALQTRDTDEVTSLFTAVHNYGNNVQNAIISVHIDDLLQFSERFDIGAGASANFNWVIPDSSQLIVANLSNVNNDALGIDDQAWAIRETEQQKEVLLVSSGNRFLETIFSTLPGYQLVRVPPTTSLSSSQTEEFDLVIFDGVVLPNTLPATKLLIIDPQTTQSLSDGTTKTPISSTGTFTQTTLQRVADSPILDHVDWANVNIRQAKRIEAPWSQTVVAADGGPLVLAGEIQNQRIVILTFSLQDSDLPLQIAFPLLMANITNWLSPGEVLSVSSDFSPGTPVEIATKPGVDSVKIFEPDGLEWTQPVDSAKVIFSDTDQLGIYDVWFSSENGETLAGHLAVNLFSPFESSIGPKQTLQIGRSEITSLDEHAIGQREIWSIFVIFAFVIMIIEWWIFHRGIRLPKLTLPNSLVSWRD